MTLRVLEHLGLTLQKGFQFLYTFGLTMFKIICSFHTPLMFSFQWRQISYLHESIITKYAFKCKGNT